MAIPGGVLIAEGAAKYLYSAAGMLRFLARLSGRRRHVRRSCGSAPGTGTTTSGLVLTAVTAIQVQTSSVLTAGDHINMDIKTTNSISNSSSSSCSNNNTTNSPLTSVSTLHHHLHYHFYHRHHHHHHYHYHLHQYHHNDDNNQEEETRLHQQQQQQQQLDILNDSRIINQPNVFNSLDDVRLKQCHSRCRKDLSFNQPKCITDHHDDHPINTLSQSNHLSRVSITSNNSNINSNNCETNPLITTPMTTSKFNSTTTTTSTKINNNSDNRSINSYNNSVNKNQEDNLKRHRNTTTSDQTNSPSNINQNIGKFRRRHRISSYLATFLVLSYTLFGITDACSARSTPKARAAPPMPRPNVTFHMYTCSSAYAKWYCLNGATCFTVKIQESLLYNCLCSDGFVGQRCEYKDLENSYLPTKPRVMLETASIAGGATIAVFLVFIICTAAYIHCRRKQKELRMNSEYGDAVDGPGRDPELRPFGYYNRPIKNIKTKNTNCVTSIEQTRMPGWNDYSQVELTRLAPINEAKRSSQ